MAQLKTKEAEAELKWQPPKGGLVCPDCGTLNPDGGSRCGNCDESLLNINWDVSKEPLTAEQVAVREALRDYSRRARG